MIAEVYTDGACGNHGPKKGQGGFAVYIKLDEKEYRIKHGVYNTTSNRMELAGMIYSLIFLKSYLDSIKKIDIFTDSKYVKNIITEGWHWGWEGKDYYNVKNSDLIRDFYVPIYKECQSKTIKIHHVKGHTGIEGNEIADKLAVEAKLLPIGDKLNDYHEENQDKRKSDLPKFLKYLQE